MNSLDWELARQRLLDSGVVNYTDGDVMDEFHAMVAERAKLEEHKAQAIKDAAAALVAPPVVEVVAPEPVVASYKPFGKKNKYRGEVA